MKTEIVKLEDGRFKIIFKKHWWSSRWYCINRRFLSRKNAEAYAERFVWKCKHPFRYRRMLLKRQERELLQMRERAAAEA